MSLTCAHCLPCVWASRKLLEVELRHKSIAAQVVIFRYTQHFNIHCNIEDAIGYIQPQFGGDTQVLFVVRKRFRFFGPVLRRRPIAYFLLLLPSHPGGPGSDLDAVNPSDSRLRTYAHAQRGCSWRPHVLLLSRFT